MKKVTYILIFALLMLLSLFLVQKCGTDTKTEELKEAMTFTIPNMNQVHRLLIANRTGRPAHMHREGNDWYLDNGVKANPYVLEGIFDVLENARVQYIPAQEEVDRLMPLMATKGIKVEAYGKNDEVLQSFYIGAVTQTEKGTHFYKEGGNKSYVMEMPYGQVNIRQRFNIGYDDWKDRVIFTTKVEDIASLKVQYPRSPSQGFVIQQTDGDFNIKPVVSDQPIITRPLKPDVFEKYLVTYKGVNFVEFNNDVIGRDSILNNVPFMKSELVNLEGDTFRTTMWPKSAQIATPHQAHQIENPLNGYYTLNHNGDFGTVQQIVVRGTIAGYSDFFK